MRTSIPGLGLLTRRSGRAVLAGATTLAALCSGVVMTAQPAAAAADCVKNVQVRISTYKSDIRGNTSVQFSAGGHSFRVSGDIGAWAAGTRYGSFPVCVPNSAFNSGVLVTSISNPSWPETTDTWGLYGLALIDRDNGRMLLRQGQGYLHYFSGERPSWTSNGIWINNTTAFLDTRYADCGGSEAYVRFVNPTNPGDPGAFTSVTMKASGMTSSVPAGYWGAPQFDWGGNLAAHGVTNVRDHTLSWTASYGGPWGTAAYATLYRNCDPIGF